jgi:CheY-like chemotaxis protein
MKVMVLEDNLDRIKFFIEVLGKYKLKIVDNVDEAIELLDNEAFDMIFLDNEVVGGCGADVAVYMANKPDNLNNDATIVVHCLDDQAQAAMVQKLTPTYPRTLGITFGPSLFHYLGLTNEN